MHGYDKNDLFGKKIEISVKSKSWKNKALKKADQIFLDGKTIPKKEIKGFFPKNLIEDILEDQKNILINAMKVYNCRKKIIKLFEDKNIKTSSFPVDAESEPEEYEPEKLELETFVPNEYKPEEIVPKEFELEEIVPKFVP